MNKPAERFPMPDVNSLPQDMKTMLLEIQEKSGFIPNVFLKLARRPDEFRAFFAYHDALMLRESGLSKAEKEMIVVATSATNSCLYCVVAHGALLRIYSKNPRVADQLATNPAKAELTDRQRAMIDFAMMVAIDSAEIADSDYQTLHDHGFTDDDAWDIGGIAAFFALSNRMANVSNMMPNEEFYLMGRVPRDKKKK
ncbi:MAG: peroxidase-related enzyme [Burkholderiaceae bacterium]